ncbi:hypothetical protein, partial [Thiolapillus sp.]|uniref:hypothetical protein n=3 Tax=Thiolapillus sp. TaxID=2017437 RepID=UPI0035AC095E
FKREPRVGVINDWLNSAVETDLGEERFQEIGRIFEDNEEAVRRAVDSRSKERLRNLVNTLESRKEREISDITTVLDDLARAIESELDKEQEPRQLEMFSQDERLQVARDDEALKMRLARIPEEKEREVQAIEHRYLDFTDRTFPVAVIFLLPESTVGED